MSGTATHILSLVGTEATAAILRGKATAHKPIAQLSKKRKTDVVQSGVAVLMGAAALLNPVDPEGLIVETAAKIRCSARAVPHPKGAAKLLQDSQAESRYAGNV